MQSLKNVYRLGIKELWSSGPGSDDAGVDHLHLYLSVYTAATAQPDVLHMAPIAIVDEDQSPLSGRIASAFFHRSLLRR